MRTNTGNHPDPMCCESCAGHSKDYWCPECTKWASRVEVVVGPLIANGRLWGEMATHIACGKRASDYCPDCHKPVYKRD